MAQTRTVGTHATTIHTDAEGTTHVVYHSTAVAAWNPTKIHLDTGGYETATTKARMNQAANQFGLEYQVWQKDYAWHVDYRGKTTPFTGQRMTLNRETGEATPDA